MNWKIIDIEGVKENTFEISDTGIVRYVNSGERKAATVNGEGYLYIKFFNGGNRSINIAVHRLLALHFIPRTEDDFIHGRNYVHFKDFDKDNISLDNLEWVNSLELNIKTRLHYDNPCKPNYAEYICKLLERDYDNASICKVLDLPRSKFGSIISNIRRRKIYKDISKKYKF